MKLIRKAIGAAGNVFRSEGLLLIQFEMLWTINQTLNYFCQYTPDQSITERSAVTACCFR